MPASGHAGRDQPDHLIINDAQGAREDLIGLARVSTDAQELARQIDALKMAGRARIYLGKASP